jgi:hypothetical protein
MIYTSYFDNVPLLKSRNNKLTFVSVAGRTPQFNDAVIYKMKELAPQIEWWNLWHKLFITNLDSKESKCWYKDKYYVSVLKKLKAKDIEDKLLQLSNGNDVVLLCYEEPDKFCHRHLISEWFNENNILCEEMFIV